MGNRRSFATGGPVGPVPPGGQESDPHGEPSRRTSGLTLPAVVLVVLCAVAVAGFVATRHLVDDHERRVTAERAGEAALFVSSSIGGTSSTLDVLAAAAIGTNGTVSPAFERSASRLNGGRGGRVVLVRLEADGPKVLATVGAAPAAGSALTADRAALALRADTTAGMVAARIDDGGPVALVFARGLNGIVVMQEVPIRPATPLPVQKGTPFSDLRVAVYAAATPQPQALVLTTGGTFPADAVVRPVKVGVETWSLQASALHPLAGGFATAAPWYFLAIGLVTAFLATAVLVVQSRRRSYALALVAARTVDLRAAHQEAETANRSKSEFLSRMSHELRTPLNAVIGFAQLLDTDDLTPDQRESVAHILKGGHHLLQLINEVLDISRVESGNIALSPEPVRAGDVIGETLDLIGPLAVQRGIHLVTDNGNAWGGYVFADRQRTKQILLNLLANAVKYNRPRGTVSVSCRLTGDGRARFVVTDTGPGIAAEHLSMLFVPFERLGAEHTDVEGTGIGLALSKRLADAMGATLGVDSALGQGSTFWLELPVVEGPVERYERLGRPESPAPPAPPAERAVILHIEDNLSNLKLVERIVAQRPGLEVVAAMQGRLGLELAHQHTPFLVLLDLHLPDMSGAQVLERLRDDPVTAGIPVVILSADATPGQVQRLLAAGASEYLTKPIDVRELLRVMDQAAVRP
jgi:signal transduction histidine kinase/CheY-like chemotaxis protein